MSKRADICNCTTEFLCGCPLCMCQLLQVRCGHRCSCDAGTSILVIFVCADSLVACFVHCFWLQASHSGVLHGAIAAEVVFVVSVLDVWHRVAASQMRSRTASPGALCRRVMSRLCARNAARGKRVYRESAYTHMLSSLHEVSLFCFEVVQGR